MRGFSLVLFLFVCTFCLAQEDVSGSWTGKITQNDGGYRKNYKFELYLIQNGSQLSGRSYVYFDDIYAEMSLKGYINAANELWFSELEIVDFRELRGMEWCIKNGKLQLKKIGNHWKLEGFWKGNTSFGECIPGEVFLERVVPRA